MSDPTEPTPKRPMPTHRRVGVFLIITLLLAMVFVGGVVLSVMGRAVQMPEWVTARVEAGIDDALGPVGANLAGMEVQFEWGNFPRVRLQELRLRDAEGRQVLSVPALEAAISGRALLEGRVEMRRLSLAAARVTLRRDENGEFDLALGGDTPTFQAGSLAEVLDQLDGALALPALSVIESVAVENLDLIYLDARAGRTWSIREGLLTLDQTDEALNAQVFLTLYNDAGTPSEFAFGFETEKGSPATSLSASFSDVQSDDIAQQSPAFAFLSVIRAPISGAVRAGVGADGALLPLSGVLDIGEGDLIPTENTKPVHFDGAKGYFQYDPAAQRVALNQVELTSGTLTFNGGGQAYLQEFVQGLPTVLVAQMGLKSVALNPDGVFQTPVTFTGGAADMKITLDPFSVDLGQAVLLDAQNRAIRAKGRANVSDAGWHVALDAYVDTMSKSRLLRLWPVAVVPKTRKWVTENIAFGIARDAHAALRLEPGEKPRFQLTHGFEGGEVRFMKTMPHATEGSGYITLTEQRFVMSLEQGIVTAPNGQVVDLTGTIVNIDDITKRPAYGTIDLHMDGPIPAVLSLIDQPPLTLMQRAGQGIDIADGRAVVRADLGLELRKGVKPNEVTFDVVGDLYDVTSDVLVPGRSFAAPHLRLTATPEAVAIAGTATVDGVSFTGGWTQQIGPEHAGKSSVSGTILLSEQNLAAFGVDLPRGMVRGTGRGALDLDLVRGEAPQFRLSSDLDGIGLSIPAIAWSKGTGSTGNLTINGRLGAPIAIDDIALSAPGLSAAGDIVLAQGGGVERIELSKVSVGRWFDGSVILTGRGAGRPMAVRVTGGQVDLTALPDRLDGGGSGGNSTTEIALNRLIVADGLVVTDLDGTLSTAGGLNGSFIGSVPGGARFNAALAPSDHGTAVRIRSEQAGEVLRGANVFAKARGGSMDLILTPLEGEGRYNGRMDITNVRVRGVGALAELLSAVSVVGLIEQLSGEGLAFTSVEARFTLTPEGVEIRRGSAVGPSLGISMAGVYEFAAKRLDLQGVVSPIYLVNSIGSVLTRKGEGLFGFNYRLRGPADDPKVSVNPLSILTPGMFREIFRRPPPELGN